MIKTKSKPRRKARPTSPYSLMNATELAEATKQFDVESEIDLSRPLTPGDRAMIANAKHVGRPKIGHGAKVISITVERSLLDRLDAFAAEKGMSRAQAVALAIKGMIGVTLSPTPRRSRLRQMAALASA